jgi:hypothetical protein
MFQTPLKSKEVSLNGPEVFTDIKQQFASAISAWDASPFEPLAISPWLAAALLQKSIRRGDENFALQAAATLLQISPDRLWRRCAGIAAEDVGLGSVDVVALVTAALAGKRFRAGFDGEWNVASFIVSQMASATKCRSSDDLLMCAERHPSLAHARREFVMLGTRELLNIVTGSASLPERGLALWYALGTGHRPSPWLRARWGEPGVVFDQLCEAGLPHTLVEIGRELFRRTGEPLGPFLSLLAPQRQTETAAVADDDIPPVMMIGQLPSWSTDRYSREGLACLQLFLRGDGETARWVGSHIRTTKRVDFLGDVLFRAEGQISKARLHWATADELRRLVDIECAGDGCADATEILTLMRTDLPELNRVRVELLGGQHHAN